MTIDLSCLYSISIRITVWPKRNDKYSRRRKRNNLTHKHTYAHTNTHTHTHTHTHFRFFSRLWGAPSTVHVWISFPPGFVMFIVYINFIFDLKALITSSFLWLLPILIANWRFKPYRRIPFSFEILMIMLFMLWR